MKEYKKKVALHNLGCKVNSYETDAMKKILQDHGYQIVPFEPGADIYIINTCTVTNIADRKSRQMLHRAKKMNPAAVVVAVGCYVQTAEEQLKSDGTADILVGNNKKQEIVRILEEYEAGRKTECIIDIKDGCTYEEAFGTGQENEHVRAYIKIQDGCNQFCSYCIIPYARGRVRSRRMDDILNEAEKAVAQGYQEIVLTGIHLSSYGIDMEEPKTLLQVICACASLDGIRRIRLGSLEPGIITEEFVAALAQEEKFCPHFHLSLQSGCDATLKRMNRKYTTGEYSEKCQIIRKYFKNGAITTDVIVGFAGETEEEFAKTAEFLSEIQFASMHIFKYSKRNGTQAASMPGQVDDNKKNQRSSALIKLERDMHKKFVQKFIGEEVQVLVEEKIIFQDKEYHTGYTKEYVRVIFADAGDHENEIVKVKGVATVWDKKSKEEILLAEI